MSIAALTSSARQSTQQPPQQSTQANPATPASDETGKAAERKRRFEEQKRQLENSDAGSQVGSQTDVNPDQTLFLSPSVVNMLVGDFHSFCVYDIDGKVLTREAEWTIDDSGIATLNKDGLPAIASKQSGRATLRARVGNRSAEASITVRDGTSLPTGTIKWSVPNYPGYKSKQIVQAMPSSNGPDIYTIEENDRGESLIRAWTNEGVFLWLRKSKQRIVGAIPH